MKINEIICILDASGSMEYQKEAVVSGFNKFLLEQKKTSKDSKTLLSVMTFRESYISPNFQFNSQIIQSQFNPWNNQFNRNITNNCKIDTLYNRVDILEAKPLQMHEYICDGCTPLYDAVGTIISNTQDRIKKNKSKIHSILVVIMTDGAENASKYWNKSTLKSLISAKSASNWNFLFIGSNLDSFEDPKELGLGDFFVNTTGNDMKSYESSWYCANSVANSCFNSNNGTYSSANLNSIVNDLSNISKVTI